MRGVREETAALSPPGEFDDDQQALLDSFDKLIETADAAAAAIAAEDGAALQGALDQMNVDLRAVVVVLTTIRQKAQDITPDPPVSPIVP
jgi:hypothetical protein